MNYKMFNTYCESLGATSYVVQWGDSHVWKVGGKVFAIGGWEKIEKTAITFKTSEANFFILQEEAGFRPAPYMASRGLKWIQIYDVSAVTAKELKAHIFESYQLVSAGLTKKLQRELGLLEK